MTERIAVGDLVEVVRWPHRHVPVDPRDNHLGTIETVDTITAICFCSACGEPQGAGAILSNGYGIPVSWLRRFPPLSELEGQRSQESIKLPGQKEPA